MCLLSNTEINISRTIKDVELIKLKFETLQVKISKPLFGELKIELWFKFLPYSIKEIKKTVCKSEILRNMIKLYSQMSDNNISTFIFLDNWEKKCQRNQNWRGIKINDNQLGEINIKSLLEMAPNPHNDSGCLSIPTNFSCSVGPYLFFF